MYVIIELQTNDGQTSTIVATRETKDEAMSVYHTILASASVSSVQYHTAVVMDEQGKYIARECYMHEVTNEQES